MFIPEQGVFNNCLNKTKDFRLREDLFKKVYSMSYPERHRFSVQHKLLQTDIVTPWAHVGANKQLQMVLA